MNDAISMTAIAVSVAVLVAALTLAAAFALAVASALRWAGPWLRSALVLGAKAFALLPFVALTWSFLGFWLGGAGWPVESLMPVPAPARTFGVAAWKWLLPVFLLAAPLAAELIAFLLRQPRPNTSPGLPAKGVSAAQAFYQHELPRLWFQMRGKLLWLCLLGGGYLIALEDILNLPGAAAALAKALRSSEPGSWRTPAVAWGAVAACAGVVVLIVHRLSFRTSASAAKPRTQARALMEGAVTIGLSRSQGWRRHVLPGHVRAVLSGLFEAASWAVVCTVLVSAVIGRGPGIALWEAGNVALDDPMAPLRAAVAPALCALFLWLAGRIVAPRSIPQAHG
ncbi:MAG TPA: hypothetical protein VD994_14095 [Prosthecobacter sp.]|nr:hypothetical protein [Prosthecobacter sp.]